VKILIDISPDYYDRLLSELSEESRIYAILKNGVVIHQFERGTEFRTVEILCEKFHARMILAKPSESRSATPHLVSTRGALHAALDECC
jgi:hypothetical protein